MFNNEKICLTWILPRQLKSSFLKEKLLKITKFLIKNFILFLKKVGGVDKILVQRHLTLTFYAYIFCPFVFFLFSNVVAMLAMFIFQTINIYYFLKRSQKIEKEGWVLRLILSLFGFLAKKLEKHKKISEILEFLLSFLIFIIDPLLSVIKYERAEHQKYWKNKETTVLLFVLFSSFVATLSWSLVIHYTGIDTHFMERTLNYFRVNPEIIEKILQGIN